MHIVVSFAFTYETIYPIVNWQIAMVFDTYEWQELGSQLF